MLAVVLGGIAGIAVGLGVPAAGNGFPMGIDRGGVADCRTGLLVDDPP
ncbi:hypothetical protein YERSI8AC_40179 [Enterobacterales bacterium 8AC]|nr:hypothetical protein YERSI8AC_40179 [Enterobacterales bacterium 8AC]